VASFLEGGIDAGKREGVKGWPWGSGSHTNMVMAILHRKGGFQGFPLKMFG